MKYLLTRLVCLSLAAVSPALGAQVIINEIMYHASPAIPEDDAQEWIELFNTGTNAVNLDGWKFSKSVSFTFTNVSIPAGGYLVVCASRAAFASRYPTVTNVVGDWVGVLSNNGDEIRLDDVAGQIEDDVAYASQGDWAQRQRGQNNLGHYGWIWFTEADGFGKSLELINPALPSQYGQNWKASLTLYGTPGRANSVATNNVAPLILDAAHFPTVPKSTDSVIINARILDEQTNGVTASLFYRTDASPANAFASTPMFDDGLHEDGLAGDGVYGAVLPAAPNNTIIDFYIRAVDAQGVARTFPGPALQLDGTTLAQTANLLYQVLDDFSYSGSQPVYLVLMTEIERAELDAIGSSGATANSDATMNGTFISIDGTGTEVRYTMGFRNRGHGSRTARPNNIRVNFNNDQKWKGVRAMNLN